MQYGRRHFMLRFGPPPRLPILLTWQFDYVSEKNEDKF